MIASAKEDTMICSSNDNEVTRKRANNWSVHLHLFVAFLFLVASAPSLLCSTEFTYQPCPLSNQLSTSLAKFKANEICDTVNLVGAIEQEDKYSHCRAVNGFVSIRHWTIESSVNGSLNILFPKLEIITHFLLLYNISSANGTTSLNTIFPKLRLIAGRQQFLNHTVYISKFFADDEIEMNNLAEVCGPIWLQYSPLVCFRYSNLYWRLVPQISHKDNYNKFFEDLNVTKNLLNLSVQEDHIDARLSIDFKMPSDKRPEFGSFTNARFSIFDIDLTMYKYITGEKAHQRNCSQHDRIKVENAFEFADLVNSDHVNVFLVNHMKQHLETYNPLGKVNLSSHCITEPPNKLKELKPEFALTQGHYDIRHIYHSLIAKPQFDSAYMDEMYVFKYDHLYIIKVLLCFGPSLHQCTISQFRKLFLKKSMFSASGIRSPDSLKKGTTTYTPTLIANYSSEKSSQYLQFHFTTAAIVLGILLLFMVMLILVPRAKQCLPVPSWFRVCKADVVSDNPDYTAVGSSIWSSDHLSDTDLPEDTAYEIERSNVKVLYNKLLGRGEFGNVYHGLLFPNTNQVDEEGNIDIDEISNLNNGATRVAIKMLRENTKELDKERFISEAKLMRTFKSNFLVRLIGVCTLQEPTLVVMEYMDLGDLKRYLRQKYQDYLDKHDFSIMPTFDSTIRMAIQIADGMFYLHSKRIIHRDLAARNCMVAADLTVKIGDFGMTRGIYLSDYYRLSESALMPLRWMAPESIRKQVFTQQTDIWSYGVVLWEIMSFGEQPYKGKTDQEVKELLIECVRLNRPPYFTQVMWEIAKSCWHKNPNNRPTFFTIIESLYFHLGKQREEFKRKSHYHSCGTLHRRSLGFSVWNFISEHCLDFMGKFSHQHREHEQLEDHPEESASYSTPQPFTGPHQQTCQPIPQCYPGTRVVCSTMHPPSTCFNAVPNPACRLAALPPLGVPIATPFPVNFNRFNSLCRSSLRSNGTAQSHQLYPPRARCYSFDSFQTNTSDATTFTLISNGTSQYEPSIQSRHNSAGSNNSATSNISEQAPLI